MEILDQIFIKEAEKVTTFNFNAKDVTSIKYKNEIRHIITKFWFSNIDTNQIYLDDNIETNINKSIQLMKEYDIDSFEKLYSYNMKGIGPGEILLFYIINSSYLGGGNSAGVDIIFNSENFEIKAVKPISNKIMDGIFLNDFKVGGTVDLTQVIQDLQKLGNIKTMEFPGSKINLLRRNEKFLEIENKYRKLVSEYFKQHKVIFINNSTSLKRGEVIRISPIDPNDIFIERMTSGTVKPLIKIS